MLYEIWGEGYAATGQSAGAYFFGKQEAKTFQEACDIFFKDDKYYDSKHLSHWSCHLFDNEKDARKNFG